MDAIFLARQVLQTSPVYRAAGLAVLLAEDGAARVTLVPPHHLTDGDGSLHPAGLVALLHATARAALVASCPVAGDYARLEATVASATMDFRGHAHGRLAGECTVDEHTRGELSALLAGGRDRIRAGTLVEITDARGAIICSSTLRWNLHASTAGTGSALSALTPRFPPSAVTRSWT